MRPFLSEGLRRPYPACWDQGTGLRCVLPYMSRSITQQIQCPVIAYFITARPEEARQGEGNCRKTLIDIASVCYCLFAAAAVQLARLSLVSVLPVGALTRDRNRRNEIGNRRGRRAGIRPACLPTSSCARTRCGRVWAVFPRTVGARATS